MTLTAIDAMPARPVLVPTPAGWVVSRPRRPEVATGRVAHSGPSALSGREREVLALMAEGRSNRAIADDLFVSAGAVEKHVASIFAKLGLRPCPRDHRRVLAVLAYLGGH